MTDRLTRRRFLGAGTAVAAGLALSACNLDRASKPDRADGDPPDGWGGDLFDPPLEKPPVTLQTVDGEDFDLRADTAGKLTFLFFGYTNCPDQCPIYLSSLARAIESIDGPGSKPQVLFVGVDTARDTPEVLKTYLGNVNPTFIGLTGTPAKIAEANDFLKFPAIEIGEPDAAGDYLVGHYGRAVAFTPDDLGHRLYGFDTRQQEFAKDLPRLAEGTYE